MLIARLKTSGLILLTLSLSFCAGFGATNLTIPLPWVLGPLVAVGLAAFAGIPVVAMNPLRPAMSAVIGTMIGASFAPDFLSRLVDWTVPLLGLLACSAIGAAVSSRLLSALPGMTRETSFFASMPGGILEMATLCRERGGDERIVALVHAGRIFIVVISLPVLFKLAVGHHVSRAGATRVTIADTTVEGAFWFALIAMASFGATRYLRVPARYMVIPMTFSAIVHANGLSDFRLPFELVAFAQMIIGTSIGSRFAGINRSLVVKALGISAISSIVMILIALIFAILINRLTGKGLDTLLLAYVPGGLAEMSLIAVAMQLDVAFVVVHHIFRIVAVVMLAGFAFDRVVHRWRTP